MEQNIWLTFDDIHDLSRRAAEGCGASHENATSLAASITAAEAEGMRNVGLAHLPDYCEGMLAGRIDGSVTATVERPTPIVFRADVHSGLPHPAFDSQFDDFVAATKQFGVALFSLRNGFTCGALGYFVRRLADAGLVALAAANAGPAKVVVSGGNKPVFGTNPLAFAVPGCDGAAMIIDQSTSATAFVNVRAAAAKGELLPDDWAVDAQGRPTNDPEEAIAGALRAFGGYKGTNIALMVEMLSAGVTGSNWSCDAPRFNEGDQCPDVGLFIVAISPEIVCDKDFNKRVADFAQRYESDFSGRLPGGSRLQLNAENTEGVWVPAALVEKVKGYAEA